MKTKSNLHQRCVKIIQIGVILFFLSACSQMRANTVEKTAPTMIAENQAKEWTYVALGSSFTWGVQPYFAKYLEEDLGVRVKSYDHTSGGQAPSSLVTRLRDRPLIRERVEQADVITLSIGGKGSPPSQVEDCVGSDGKPKQAVLQSFREEYDALLDELLLHTDPSRTLVRVLNMYNPIYSRWKTNGSYVACRQMWIALNEEIRESVEEHGLTLVDVFSAFNGPDYDEDPRDKGLISQDGEHTSEAGQRMIADLLRQVGYTYETTKDGGPSQSLGE